MFADAAYGAGHLDVTIETWERAYAELSAAGESLAAAGAAVRVAMHLLFDTALMAPVRGWLARAEQLLDGDGETPVHAWFAVVRSYERMLSGDPDGARRGPVEPSRSAPHATPRPRPSDGSPRRACSSSTATSTAAWRCSTRPGSRRPRATSTRSRPGSCTASSCARCKDWPSTTWPRSGPRRWSAGRGRQRHRQPPRPVPGASRRDPATAGAAATRPRPRRSTACDELRPYLRRELGWPLSELGRIRLHTGDVAGAEEALLAAHQAGWDPQPGLALVLLAQGDVADAAASIRDALDHPSLGAVEGATTEHRSATGAPARRPGRDRHRGRRPRRGAGRLPTSSTASPPASRARRWPPARRTAEARVQLADGDASDAQRLFAEAARLWSEVGAPYETAVARLGLADAYRAVGADAPCRPRSSMRPRTALDRIATGADPAPPIPLAAAPRGHDQRTQPFRREGDYWSVTFEGRTTQVRDRKGMRHLARLLASPGARSTCSTSSPPKPATLSPADEQAAGAHLAFGDAGAMLDAQAKQAYRRRLAEIDDDIETPALPTTIVREAQADAEREFLIRELSRAVGLGGRDRRAGSASERARAGVTRAIRQAIARIKRTSTRPRPITSSAPSAPAPTAPTSPTPASPTPGTSDAHRRRIGSDRAHAERVSPTRQPSQSPDAKPVTASARSNASGQADRRQAHRTEGRTHGSGPCHHAWATRCRITPSERSAAP